MKLDFLMKRKGFPRRAFNYGEYSTAYEKATLDNNFRKFWKKEVLRRMLKQKVCLYCEKIFTGDKGAVLHHRKMQEKEKEAYKEIVITKEDMRIGLFDTDEGRKKLEEIEDCLINYYRSLKETDLICVKCHANIHSGKEIEKREIQRKLF